LKHTLQYTPTAPITKIHQCREYKGKYYHINFDKTLYTESRCLWQNMPLYVNNELNTAPDGVYTWALVLQASDEDDTKQVPTIYAYRVLTAHEVGTKHADIFARLRNEMGEGDYDIYGDDEGNLISGIDFLGSGEFMKTGNNLRVNFISGTYMLMYFQENNIEGESRKQIIRELAQLIKDVLEDYTNLNVTTEIDGNTFITDSNIQLNANDLTVLLNCGAQIRRFDKLEDCRDFHEYVKDSLLDFEVEEEKESLRQTYKNIEVPEEFQGKFEIIDKDNVQQIGGGFLRFTSMKKRKSRKQTKKLHIKKSKKSKNRKGT